MADIALSGADLDLLELALTVDPALLRTAVDARFTDLERTPLAAVVDGSVARLRPFAPRPDLALDGVVAVDDAAARRATAALVLDALPTRSQVAVADALPGEVVAWIALTGRSGAAPGPLLGAVAAAAAAWAARTGRAAVVVALPWSLDAAPEHLPLPPEFDGADALAAWLTAVLRLEEAVVLGASEEHRALAALEGDAAGAARALFPAEVLPFHRRERVGGLVLLLTGLPGSGKSTLAQAVAARIALEGATVSVLDGDAVRQLLSAGLGFSPEDRALNVRRIGWVAAEVARAGGVAVAAPIAPFATGRAEARRIAVEAGARFVLVHVATPLEVCEARDRKGHYAAARAGDLPDFTGVSSPYEPPTDADVVVDLATTSTEDAVVAVLEAVGR